MSPEQAWCLFFSTIVGWQFHPRVELKDRLTLAECAAYADEMVKEYVCRIGPLSPPSEET